MIKRGLPAVVAGVLWVLAATVPSMAADKGGDTKAGGDVTWVYPVIPKFGGVHPRPDADMQPDPNVDYKVFVDVVSTGDDPSQQMDSLDRLARLVNLMGYAKVPTDHVHIVALLDRRSGMAGLTDAAYARLAAQYIKKHPEKHLKIISNPNLAIVHALKKAGVKLMICSQAMAELGLKDGDIDPSITITLSALTDPVIYGQRGYTFMQL